MILTEDEKAECKIYTGHIRKDGYGKSYREDYAHRTSWEVHNKKVIPSGMCVLHKCDNKSCINPNHLYIGTQAENIRDMRERNPPPIEMTAHPKLYEGEIWLIRKLRVYLGKSPAGRNKYKFSIYLIGKMFKMSPQNILNIWNSDKTLCRERKYI